MAAQHDSSIIGTLRRAPGQTARLLKVALAGLAVIVAWDILAAMALPAPAVKGVLAILIVAYACSVAFTTGRVMLAARREQSTSTVMMKKLNGPRRGLRDFQTGAGLHAPADGLTGYDEDADGEAEGAAPEKRTEPEPAADASLFNQTYFLLRLHEQVKDARREGREMCVAAVEVTVPGAQMTLEVADRVAREMAKIAATQRRVIGQPLAVSESEYVFSLPAMNARDTKTFVSEVVQALGDYWCHFGIASFPRNATDAEGLVEKAFEACETSRTGGRTHQLSAISYQQSA